MKDLLFKYGAVLGARHTKNQKKVFLDKVIDEVYKANITVKILRNKIGVKECIHCLINDTDKSEYVVMAAYDTPLQAFLNNNFYYPFNNEKNKKNQNKELAIRASASILGLLFLTLLIYIFPYATFLLKVLILPIILVFVYFIIIIIRGRANKFNMNRNSAAVSLLLDMAINYTQSNISFILLDEACESQIGFASIREIVKDKKVLILDCLASGETLIKASFKNSWSKDIVFDRELNLYNKTYEKDNKFNLILNVFNNPTYLGSGDIIDGQYVVRQGRNKEDYHVDVEKLGKIRDSLLRSMKGKK